MSTYQRRSTWADLAPELLELILQRLTLMDYLKCREICSSWRKVVNDALATEGRCGPASQLPMMLTLSPSRSANLMSIHQRGVFAMSTQNWDGRIEKVQSVQGWLMFQRFYYENEKDKTYSEFTFFNPVSRARFKLPVLSLFRGRWDNYLCNQITFEYAPDSPEFLVVALISVKHRRNQVKQLLALCKVTQGAWTFIEIAETRTNTFLEIAVHDGKLYAATQDVRDFVIVFSLRDPNAITAKRIAMLGPKPIPTVGHPEIKNGIRHDIDNEICMLTMDATSGNLFLVFHIRDRVRVDKRKYSLMTKGFRVFKLDLSGPKWSEVKHLGDRFMLFDWTRIRVISARGFDDTQEFNDGNCIFFCHANTYDVDPFPKHDFGVFFLADNSIRRFTVNSSLPAPVRDLWFSPNPW